LAEHLPNVPISAQAIYEQTLVVRSQLGDEEAFRELLGLYSARLDAFARKLAGRDASHRVEDIVQESWVAIHRGLPSLLDVARFRSWAFRITRDRLFAEFRRRKVTFEPLSAVDPDQLATAEPESSSVDLEELQRCLHELTPDHREVLLLRYFEEMNYDEIAQVTNCSMGTVRSRIHYAKRALRRALENLNYEHQSR
jgi:RNA polymerase sigma-70 factor (ECF subfamily)